MRILALGDIVGKAAVKHLSERLWELRRRERIDFVIANGENATDIRGVAPQELEALLQAGVDVITLGNHTYGLREIYPYLESEERVIRPANYPPQAPGSGYTVVRIDGYRILCISVEGRVFMDTLADPFDTVERILAREAGNYDLAVMDVHAEATSEKLAMAHVFDGRIAVIFGTHTHVPTADTQLLPRGSAYVTDLGMCGPIDSILGTKKETVIERFRSMMPVRFTVAEGDVCADGVIFEVDPDRSKQLEPIRIRI